MTTLVNRIEIGATPVVVDLEHCVGGLRVSVERARAPKERYLGDGSRVLLYGPGRDQRRVTISGTTRVGYGPPDLSGETLSAPVDFEIYWPMGVTSTFSAVTAGVDRFEADQHSGLIAWQIVGVGAVSDGLDPLTGETVTPSP